MGEQFSKFKRKHGSGTQCEVVSTDIIEAYNGKLPAELLLEWKLSGWCCYGDGLLWTVDPSLYTSILHDWLEKPSQALVFMRTAFGGLVYWDGAEYFYIDVTAGDITPFLDQIDYVFERLLCKDSFLDNVIHRDVFKEVLPSLGILKKDECYAFVPPLAMGGPGTADTVQRVKLREHLALLAQLKG